MEQPIEWPADVSATIARELRRHRTERSISAQQLADACARLGHPALQRTVISNIENGRRRDVSVADLLVLAAALEVAPAALVFPAGYAAETEYLPGRTATPLEAVDWFAGVGAPEDSALALARRHQELERRIRGVYRRIWEQGIAEQRYVVELEDAEAEAGRTMARELTDQLMELREEMTRRGLEVPPLPGLERPTG
ncbi:helix-turn-helix domain-containing protein [Streptomyces fuscigenes]|uniref:helix-turn-helix domain-containing protein n=1 Tax=Streptomyces fuscigenes TaxID=1528880 RepID=UPI001F47F9E0|nr:helix-turn-helix domain-containing protein [Streptomyces fuscigenes]MCF3960587.1 helix-turn-helix domain-containing protein [Streptomyces fuscigenes]